MVNAQTWLESQTEYDTKEKREKVTELDISKLDLEGDLDLTDFVNLKKLICSSNKLTSLNVSRQNKLESLKSQLKQFYCYKNDLTNLDLNSCSELEIIDCSGNLLTEIKLPFKSNKLKKLYLGNNNFPQQDLSLFKDLVNLEELSVGNYWETSLREISTGNYQENKIKRNIYNRFTGSLELLKESVNLSLVEINNTDIDSGLEYLNLDGDGKAIVYCSADERPNCRVKVIEEKLSPYQGSIQVWKRANSELVIVALCKQLKKTKEDKTQLESKLQIEREKFKKFQNKSAEHQQQRENKIKELELENTHLRQQLKNLQLNQEQLEIQIEVNSNKK